MKDGSQQPEEIMINASDDNGIMVQPMSDDDTLPTFKRESLIASIQKDL